MGMGGMHKRPLTISQTDTRNAVVLSLLIDGIGNANGTIKVMIRKHNTRERQGLALLDGSIPRPIQWPLWGSGWVVSHGMDGSQGDVIHSSEWDLASPDGLTSMGHPLVASKGPDAPSPHHACLVSKGPDGTTHQSHNGPSMGCTVYQANTRRTADPLH